jgi:hypothetical protein
MRHLHHRPLPAALKVFDQYALIGVLPSRNFLAFGRPRTPRQTVPRGPRGLASEDKLRDEIIAFQKARSDILLWKLIAMGGVGAAGLGLLSVTPSGKEAILGIIPFVAVYCDAVSHDYDLRIALIATFLRRPGGPFSEYESFTASVRSHWTLVGLSAHIGSSLLACILILLVGCHTPATDGNGATRPILLASAAIGIFLLILVEIESTVKRARITKDLPPGKTDGGTPSG